MSVRILDGGTGQAIFRQLGSPAGGWSARVNLEEPEIVRGVHEAFLRAGAEIITTNTYAAGRHRMNLDGLADDFAAANRAACEAAETARERVGTPALVAGSLGPLRGSFQPDRVPPPAVMEPEFAEQALVLAPHVDLFLVETMTMGAEAAAAARAAASTGKPVWVAFTLDERGPPRLRSDETIETAVDALAGIPVDAILLNCTAPEAVSAGMPRLAAAAGGGVVGGYANGFVTIPDGYGISASVSDLAARSDLSPAAYAAHAADWIAAGATIVGGCCEVGPDHIAALAAMVRGAP